MAVRKIKVYGVSDIFVNEGGDGDSAYSVFYANGNGNHINHGYFWKPGQTLGPCMWEAWFMPDQFDPSRYIISDGYGGAHALLWSGMSGNINFKDSGGTDHLVSYFSSSVPPPNTFSHCMVQVLTDSSGNQWIETSINGISVGKTPVPAGYTRAVSSGLGGQGTLYVMGSDHSNSRGWIAQIRGWDTVAGSAGSVFLGDAFVPQRAFSSLPPIYGPSPAAPVAADFLASYIGPAGQLQWPDIGRGYDSNEGFAVRSQHTGFAAAGGVNEAEILAVPKPSPIPVPSPSTQAPFYPGYVDTPPNRGYTPLAPPPGAKRYDSFSRPDQTYSHVSVPDAGSTESGSLGPAVWQSSIIAGAPTLPSRLQLFDRSLRVGQSLATPLAYIPYASDLPDMTVAVTRIDPSQGYNDGLVGCAARVGVDGLSGYVAFFQYIPGIDSSIYMYRIDGASNNTLIGYAPSVSRTGWSKLKIVTLGSNIQVLIDSTSIISSTDDTYSTQRGAGICFTINFPVSTVYAATDFAVF